MVFVQVLMDFEDISAVVEAGTKRLAYGWQATALNDDNGAVDFGDGANDELGLWKWWVIHDNTIYPKILSTRQQEHARSGQPVQCR
jgi:hypothetical protein